MDKPKAKSNAEDKPKLPQLPGPRVIQEVIDKADALVKQVGPLGHPRAMREDVVGALIDAATPESAAEALTGYNPKLGKALAELDKEPDSETD